MLKKILPPVISAILLYLIYYLWLPTFSIGYFDGFWFFVFIEVAIGINIMIIASEHQNGAISLILICVISTILFIGGLIAGCTLFNATTMHNQLGTANEISFDDMIHEIDNAQIPIVDDALAQKHADKKLVKIQH